MIDEYWAEINSSKKNVEVLTKPDEIQRKARKESSENVEVLTKTDETQRKARKESSDNVEVLTKTDEIQKKARKESSEKVCVVGAKRDYKIIKLNSGKQSGKTLKILLIKF